MQRGWLMRYGKVVLGIPGPSTRYTGDALLPADYAACICTITRIGLDFFFRFVGGCCNIKIKAKLLRIQIYGQC